MTTPYESAITELRDVLRSSVQMVMLSAPEPDKAAAFYVAHLGFRDAQHGPDEAIVEGFGIQIVLSMGDGGGHSSPPAPEQALEIPATMQRIEDVWDLDRQRFPDIMGPTLDPSGAFVYVTLDPAGNAIAMVAPLPSDRDDAPLERVTQRLRRPDF